MSGCVVLSVARFIAAGFGSGWVPFAPGTAGSLAALIVGYWLVDVHSLNLLLLMWLLLLPLACWSTYIALPASADKDPGWVVIDEWLGQWLTLFLFLWFAGQSWLAAGAAFAAFRLFDIWKPWLVRRVEHIGPAWWSIHADDLLAGLFAALSLMAGYALYVVYVVYIA
ncbi:MAG: phosphatidylglycerophosphatase A [Mariprofundaceae bacterium]|nr:phosphatidylglycerophosphatase A [Mariprofundaceae bacterium]